MATAPLQLPPTEFIRIAKTIEDEVGKVIVGQDQVVRGILTCVLAGGHALLEGVPGLGKTMLIRTLSDVLDLSFSRVQFTPDLMPAAITGTNVLSDDGGMRGFQFQPGPIFANIVLADEINRATPKTQSALLEAMQEHRVSVGKQTYVLQEPFIVRETQLDRFFFKLHVPFPTRDELHSILDLTTGGVHEAPGRVLDRDAILEMQR